MQKIVALLVECSGWLVARVLGSNFIAESRLAVVAERLVITCRTGPSRPTSTMAGGSLSTKRPLARTDAESISLQKGPLACSLRIVTPMVCALAVAFALPCAKLKVVVPLCYVYGYPFGYVADSQVGCLIVLHTHCLSSMQQRSFFCIKARAGLIVATLCLVHVGVLCYTRLTPPRSLRLFV